MILAEVYNVDPDGEEISGVVPLREAPMPGDTIRRADGTVVRVLRRTFVELRDGGDNQVDIELGVRIA